jgi:Fe-S-cluster containining protein
MIKDSEFDTFFLKEPQNRQSGNSPCLRCGTCCSKFQALLDIHEVEQVASGLGISNDAFISKYTDPRWGGTQSVLLRHQDGACIFLVRERETNLTSCSINSFKPRDCEAWAAHPDKPECTEGRIKLSAICKG